MKITKNIRHYGGIVLRGVAMGAADIIPGVSGGTVAFITGIYEKLISSIKSFNINALRLLFKGRFRECLDSLEWKFLLSLITGILLAVVLLAHVFTFLLNHPIYHSYLYSVFLGLIGGSIIFCFKQVRRWRFLEYFVCIMGGLAAFWVTSLAIPQDTNKLYDVAVPQEKLHSSAQNISLENYNIDSQTLKGVSTSALSVLVSQDIISEDTFAINNGSQQEYRVGDITTPYSKYSIDWWLVLCGAIAVSAMLLPGGISGSYLLNILGVYPIILGALADFTGNLRHYTIDIDAGTTLLSLGIGIVCGMILFSRIINIFFVHWRDATVAMLTGFIVGALRCVWPFWSYIYEVIPEKVSQAPHLKLVEPILPDVTSSHFWISMAFIVVSFIAVTILETVSTKRHEK